MCCIRGPPRDYQPEQNSSRNRTQAKTIKRKVEPENKKKDADRHVLFVLVFSFNHMGHSLPPTPLLVLMLVSSLSPLGGVSGMYMLEQKHVFCVCVYERVLCCLRIFPVGKPKSLSSRE